MEQKKMIIYCGGYETITIIVNQEGIHI